MMRTFFAAALLPISLAPGAARPEDVRLDVQVVERLRNRPIEGLTAADFEVIDAGRPAAITFLDSQAVPLDLVLIEPAGDPSRLEEIGKIIGDLPLAFQELRPGDRVGIVRASPKGESVLGLGMNVGAARDQLFREAPQRKARNTDCLFDAISLAARILAESGSGVRRRAIVVIADDRERGSKQTQAEATHAALKAQATVHLLWMRTRVEPLSVATTGGVPPSPLPPMTMPPREARGSNWRSIKPVITATGGETAMPDTRLARLPELIRRLHLRYLLSFSPADGRGGKLHSVTIRINGPRGGNSEVRASSGY